MTLSRSRMGVLAAALGTAWLVASAPAYAGNKVHEAHHACRELMWDKGYKGIDVSGADRGRHGRIVSDAQGRRHGDRQSVDCVYDPKHDRAWLNR